MPKGVKRAYKIQGKHSAQPERFEDVKPKKMQHDVVKVTKEGKYAGVRACLRGNGYKC